MAICPTQLLELLPVAIDENLYSDQSDQQRALIWLRKSLVRKWHGGKGLKKAEAAALATFRSDNASIKDFRIDEENVYLFETLKRARAILHEVLMSGPLQSPRVSMSLAINRMRPGPGKSQGAQLNNFLSKVFESELTVYDLGTYAFYQQNLSYRWSSAEKLRADHYGVRVVESSKLNFALKNVDESRGINTESTVDMMLQLGCGSLLEDVLEEFFGINLSRQPEVNRALARMGSISGYYATIDLKSASNRIATCLVKFLLPLPIFMCLDRIRAKCIDFPKAHGGGREELHMFSTQGNGFTFPLQTLLFACIVKATLEESDFDSQGSKRVTWSVFGDDIICPSRQFDKVVRMLEYCGFTANRTKSFSTGGFRESCGKDYFQGNDIRGVYLKELSHEQHIYTAFNRLARWSVRHRLDLNRILSFLWHLAKQKRVVPFDAGDDAGFKLPFSIATGHESVRFDRKERRWMYKQLEAVPRRHSTGRLSNNPQAIFVSMLAGYVRSGVVRREKRTRDFGKYGMPPVKEYTDYLGERVLNPQYRERVRGTTSWDFVPIKGPTALDYEMALNTVW